MVWFGFRQSSQGIRSVCKKRQGNAVRLLVRLVLQPLEKRRTLFLAMSVSDWSCGDAVHHNLLLLTAPVSTSRKKRPRAIVNSNLLAVELCTCRRCDQALKPPSSLRILLLIDRDEFRAVSLIGLHRVVDGQHQFELGTGKIEWGWL